MEEKHCSILINGLAICDKHLSNFISKVDLIFEMETIGNLGTASPQFLGIREPLQHLGRPTLSCCWSLGHGMELESIAFSEHVVEN